MSSSIPYPSFQVGTEGFSQPPFQFGLEGGFGVIPGTKAPVSNQRAHYQYPIMQFNHIRRSSPYLDLMFMFAYSHEDSYTYADELTTRIYNTANKRRKTIDGMPHRSYQHGGQYGELTIAANLPIVNYLLAQLCQNYEPTNNIDISGSNPALKRWQIPPIKDMVKLFRTMGGNITNPEVRSLRYTDGGPDVRVVCISGPVDVFNIWGCANYTANNYMFNKLRPQTKIGFVLHAILVNDDADAVATRMQFSLDDQVKESVDYTKDIVWRMDPFVFSCLEEEQKEVERFTLTRRFQVKETRGGYYADDNFPYRTICITYEPYFYRIGRIGDPGTRNFGTPMDVVHIATDPSCSFLQMQKLPTVEIHMDDLSPIHTYR